MVLKLILFLVNILSLTQAASKYYDGEIRPYEFGFNIEGNQHRHETKDARGVIMGEFGFITADNVYHVTVYATDENGDFKVLSMKNIKIGLYQVMANLQEMKNLKSTVIKNSDTPTCSSCGIPERKKQTVTDKPLSSGNIFDQGTTTNHPTSDKPNKISQIVQGTQEKTGVQESQRSYGSKGGSGVQGIQRIGGLQSTKTVPNSHDEVIQGGHGGQDAQGISVIQSPRELQEQRTPETQEIRKLQELQKFQGIKGLKSSQVHSGIQRTEGGRDTPEMQVTYRPQEIQGQRTPETKNVQKTHIPQGAQGGKETQQGKQVQITHLVKDSKESEHSKGQQGIQKIQGGQVAQILQGAQPFQGKQTLKEPKETQGGSQSSPESSGSLEQPVPPFRYLSKGFDTVNDERMQEIVKILNGITQTIQQLNSSQENNLQSADKGVPNQILRNVDEKSKAEENFQYKERGPINSAMISNNSAKIGNQAKSVNANINTNKVLMNPAISRNNQNIDRGSLNIQISSNNPESKDFQTTSDRVHQNEGKDLIIPTVLANKLSNPNTKDQNQNKKLPTINIKALEDMMDNILGDLYKFNYTVGYHGHHEHGDRSGKKEGGYYFVGRDGLERIVDYIANEFGFQPHIKLQPAKMENIPREETEKEAGLQGYEFKWFKL